MVREPQYRSSLSDIVQSNVSIDASQSLIKSHTYNVKESARVDSPKFDELANVRKLLVMKELKIKSL